MSAAATGDELQAADLFLEVLTASGGPQRTAAVESVQRLAAGAAASAQVTPLAAAELVRLLTHGSPHEVSAAAILVFVTASGGGEPSRQLAALPLLVAHLTALVPAEGDPAEQPRAVAASAAAGAIMALVSNGVSGSTAMQAAQAASHFLVTCLADASQQDGQQQRMAAAVLRHLMACNRAAAALVLAKPGELQRLLRILGSAEGTVLEVAMVIVRLALAACPDAVRLLGSDRGLQLLVDQLAASKPCAVQQAAAEALQVVVLMHAADPRVAMALAAVPGALEGLLALLVDENGALPAVSAVLAHAAARSPAAATAVLNSPAAAASLVRILREPTTAPLLQEHAASILSAAAGSSAAAAAQIATVPGVVGACVQALACCAEANQHPAMQLLRLLVPASGKAADTVKVLAAAQTLQRVTAAMPDTAAASDAEIQQCVQLLQEDIGPAVQAAAASMLRLAVRGSEQAAVALAAVPAAPSRLLRLLVKGSPDVQTCAADILAECLNASAKAAVAVASAESAIEQLLWLQDSGAPRHVAVVALRIVEAATSAEWPVVGEALCQASVIERLVRMLHAAQPYDGRASAARLLGHMASSERGAAAISAVPAVAPQLAHSTAKDCHEAVRDAARGALVMLSRSAAAGQAMADMLAAPAAMQHLAQALAAAATSPAQAADLLGVVFNAAMQSAAAAAAAAVAVCSVPGGMECLVAQLHGSEASAEQAVQALCAMLAQSADLAGVSAAAPGPPDSLADLVLRPLSAAATAAHACAVAAGGGMGEAPAPSSTLARLVGLLNAAAAPAVHAAAAQVLDHVAASSPEAAAALAAVPYAVERLMGILCAAPRSALGVLRSMSSSGSEDAAAALGEALSQLRLSGDHDNSAAFVELSDDGGTTAPVDGDGASRLAARADGATQVTLTIVAASGGDMSGRLVNVSFGVNT